MYLQQGGVATHASVDSLALLATYSLSFGCAVPGWQVQAAVAFLRPVRWQDSVMSGMYGSK